MQSRDPEKLSSTKAPSPAGVYKEVSKVSVSTVNCGEWQYVAVARPVIKENFPQGGETGVASFDEDYFKDHLRNISGGLMETSCMDYPTRDMWHRVIVRISCCNG